MEIMFMRRISLASFILLPMALTNTRKFLEAGKPSGMLEMCEFVVA